MSNLVHPCSRSCRMAAYQERQHGHTLAGLAIKIWSVTHPQRAGHRNSMCFIDYGSGDCTFLSKIAGLCPSNHNVFIGTENDPHMVSFAQSNTLHNSRIVIFEQSFLQINWSDTDRRRYDNFLAKNTRSTTFFDHYLNNYNFHMAFLRGDDTSLEAKLVVQLEEDARKRLVERSSVQQNYIFSPRSDSVPLSLA